MMIQKRQFLLLIAMAIVLLVISACSPSGGSTGGSNLTVLQVLQNSEKAMSQLKSSHIDLKANGSGQAVNVTGTVTPTTTASQVTFNLTGSGVEALPDQESMNFTVNQSVTSGAMNLAEVVQGDKVYIQNTKGRWYVLSKDKLKGYVDNPFSGINNSDLNYLIGLIEHTKITDNGIQSLNGQNLRHITIALDKEALKQFLSNSQQLSDLVGQQNLQAALDNTKAFTSTVDLWIDETMFYVHRTELKFNLNVDANALSRSITPTVTNVLIPSNVTTNLDSIVDLSQFNVPVSVTPPTNAIPTDDPTKVFA